MIDNYEEIQSFGEDEVNQEKQAEFDRLHNEVIIDWEKLKYIKNPTYDMCKACVRENGLALEFVKHQTFEICEIALKQDGYALQFVKNQTEELCEIAIKQNPHSLYFVKKQTENLCKLAVSLDGLAIKFVKKPTLDICLTALENDCESYYLIKDESIKESKEIEKYLVMLDKLNEDEGYVDDIIAEQEIEKWKNQENKPQLDLPTSEDVDRFLDNWSNLLPEKTNL